MAGAVVTGPSQSLAGLSRTKINLPQIHAKKEQLFCSYFQANLSHVQGRSGTAVPCFRAETGCGELLLAGASHKSHLGTAVTHLELWELQLCKERLQEMAPPE